MRSPIVLEGEGFDWEVADKAHAAIAESLEAGAGANMGAAMMADPGCMRCPGCDEWLWAEGEGYVGCPLCGHTWDRARMRCQHCCRPMTYALRACPEQDDPGGRCVPRRGDYLSQEHSCDP